MLSTQQQVRTLIDTAELSPWARAAYEELCAKVADEAFPCTFGTTALKNDDLRFAFLEARGEAARIDDLVAAFREYAAFIRSQPIVRASMQPLAILMPPPAGWDTIADYYAHSWRLLGEVHRRDPEPWPSGVPEDPDTPGWSFCFGGVAFFVNFKTPLHRRRRSRRMGTCYLWLVQARDGFDIVAGDTPQGRNARRIIRSKLAAYDEVAMYPALGHYGAPENREWKQYFVPESNEALSERCPFHDSGEAGPAEE